ncbi:hypothetical protein R5R35_014759 [Gryllus longicercus]|uniref:Helicase POLQ-like n=2 Tax=Gryllus longicercus TaxID=2509291 RepID=A0AAN9ZAH7_9ORTH
MNKTGAKKCKVRTVALAKHTSTQTCEADSLSRPTFNCKRSIKNLFYKRNASSLNPRATRKLMQTLFVKPRYESTPVKPTENHENSDTDCEMLVENVTPIRTRCKSFRSLNEGSDSLKQHTNRMSKSDSNVPYELCSNPTTNEMLSLDETVLKFLDLDGVEGHLPRMGKETTLNMNFGHIPGTPGHLILDPPAECSRVNSIVNEASVVVEHVSPCRSDDAKLQMLPPISVPKNAKKTSKLSQVPENCSRIADVHLDELNNIDIDNWIDDSFMERVLNTGDDPVETANANKKKTVVSKRQFQDDHKRPILNKKQKKDNNLTPGRYENRQKKENPRASETFSDLKLASVNDGILTVKQNLPVEVIKKARGIDEGTYKEQIIQNKNSVKDVSVSDSNSSMLSIGEKVLRTLVTNAQKPVVSRPKTSDVFSPAADSGNFSKLGSFFGLSSEVKVLFEKYKGIKNLYEWQEECLSLKAVEEKTNLVYALPTSGGKTLVAEILLLRELLCYKKNVLFVLPYISIVQEKVHSLSQFAIDLGFLVEEYAGGKGQYPPKKRRRKQSIYVATIEKAHSLINSMIDSKRLSEIGLTIVDELHLLGEGDRGATLECLLTKLLFSSEKIHIVGMSATIGNLEEVAKFLRAEIYVNNFRPVELKEFVKCEDFLWKVKYNEEELLEKERKIEPPYTDSMNKIDPDKVCSLVLEVVPEYSCLVFCPTKNNCENVATLFTKIMPRELLEVKKEERKALSRALSIEGRGSICSVLEKCIPYGVAYHHSGLTGDERRLLEEAYRAGTLCCICCTSTLAAGVNLPAKRVILRAPFVGNTFINLRQYKQMIGRAGRAGLDSIGESILVCQQHDRERVGNLLRSRMNNVASQLHASTSRGLQSLVLSSIGLGIANCRKDLYKMVSHTLLHVQSAILEVKSTELVDRSIGSLFKLRALQVDSTESTSNDKKEMNSSCANEKANLSLNITQLGGKEGPNQGGADGSKRAKKHLDIGRNTRLKISRLGRASMKGSIDQGRASELYNDLVKAQTNFVLLSYLHLLYLVTPYELMDQIKPDPDIYYYSFHCLNKKDQQTAHVIGINFGCVINIKRGIKSFQTVEERVVHRFYITLILNDLWNQSDVWQVAKKYNIPRGTVQTLMTASATFASCVLHFCEELKEFWAFKELLGDLTRRLSHCCSADLVQLMELPAVKTGRARQLYNAGYKTLIDIANANANDLVSSIDHLPRKIATRIIAAAKLLLLSKAENLREEAEDIVEGMFNKSFDN